MKTYKLETCAEWRLVQAKDKRQATKHARKVYGLAFSHVTVTVAEDDHVQYYLKRFGEIEEADWL